MARFIDRRRSLFNSLVNTWHFSGSWSESWWKADGVMNSICVEINRFINWQCCLVRPEQRSRPAKTSNKRLRAGDGRRAQRIALLTAVNNKVLTRNLYKIFENCKKRLYLYKNKGMNALFNFCLLCWRWLKRGADLLRLVGYIACWQHSWSEASSIWSKAGVEQGWCRVSSICSLVDL